jgi:hypothetical protein
MNLSMFKSLFEGKITGNSLALIASLLARMLDGFTAVNERYTKHKETLK